MSTIFITFKYSIGINITTSSKLSSVGKNICKFDVYVPANLNSLIIQIITLGLYPSRFPGTSSGSWLRLHVRMLSVFGVLVQRCLPNTHI